MGLAVWLFLQKADGTFQPFPTARYGRFHDGQEPLPTLAGQEARFAEVLVELEQRRATRVCRVVWPKHRLNAAGQWDPQSRQAGIRDAVESLGPPPQDRTCSPGQPPSRWTTCSPRSATRASTCGTPPLTIWPISALP